MGLGVTWGLSPITFTGYLVLLSVPGCVRTLHPQVVPAKPIPQPQASCVCRHQPSRRKPVCPTSMCHSTPCCQPHEEGAPCPTSSCVFLAPLLGYRELGPLHPAGVPFKLREVGQCNSEPFHWCLSAPVHCPCTVCLHTFVPGPQGGQKSRNVRPKSPKAVVWWSGLIQTDPQLHPSQLLAALVSRRSHPGSTFGPSQGPSLDLSLEQSPPYN